MSLNIIDAFKATLSADKSVRDQGDAVLSALVKTPQYLPQVLQLSLVQSGQPSDLRKAALLCFGRTINQIEDIKVCGQDVLVQLMTLLLNISKTETDFAVKGSVSAALSNYAQVLEECDVPWTTYFSSMLELLQMPNLIQQMIALESLSASVTFKGAEVLTDLEPQIVNYLKTVMISPNIEMRMSAIQFLSKVVMFFEITPQQGAMCKALYSAVKDTLLALIEAKNFNKFEDYACYTVELIDASEYIFVGDEINLSSLMYQFALNCDIKDSQQRAFDIIVSFIEKNPRLFKKNPAVLNQIMVKMLELMSLIDNDSAQMLLEDEEPEETENWSYAEEALLRIVEAVGGSPIKEVLFGITLQYLNSTEWNKRYSALVALSLCVAPGKYIFKNTLSDLMKIIIVFIEDKNALVLYALLDLLEELISVFPKMCRRRHFDELMKVALASLYTSSARLQEKACYVMNQLFEEDSTVSQKLLPYLPQLMEGIFKALQTGDLNSCTGSLSMIVFTARILPKAIEAYYPQLKTVLDVLMPRCNTPETKEHLAKMIEIKSVFTLINNSYFPESRDLVLKTFGELCNSPEIFSPMMVYILSAIDRFCEARDQLFMQYLGPVITLMLKRLLLKEGGEVVDIVEAEISSTTTLTEEKQFMMGSLFKIANSVKENFGPYVQDTLNVVLPMVNGVATQLRDIAAHIIPTILEDAILMIKAKGVSDPQQILGQISGLYYGIVDHLCGCLKTEKFSDNIRSFLVCLKMIICLVGTDSLQPERIGNVFESMDCSLKNILESPEEEDIEYGKAEDQENLDDEEFEKIQDNNEMEDDWLSLILDITSNICRLHPTRFFDPFKFKLFPRVMTYLNQTKETEKLSFAIAIIGSVIIDGKIYDFVPQIAEQFITFGVNKDIDVAQNAIFFLGQFAHAQIPQFVPYIPKVLQFVGSMLQRKKSRVLAELTDQVIMCVMHIVANYYQSIPNYAVILQQVITLFPAKGSFDEITTLLVDLHAKNLLSVMVGGTAENVYKLVLYFARALENEGTEDDTKKRIAQLIQAMSSFVQNDVINQVWAKLTLEQRGDLDSLFH
ncbi:importin beta-3, putative [Entamoeba invadens IP1]|uniref:importin beta-3, putative n=1 Tax=Entamoeba invadens IP1 TaxID=370355 RepID=UPI0002C3FB4A|nr:importin beta-3, putative [Entamoeba invadens IP1]ELP90774.1 importin beta-3, putative [Entamoeba invadens IP1]|eukprot:XP_004257545.1 importin beta-3, putative [Entamoeba invadens IP1]